MGYDHGIYLNNNIGYDHRISLYKAGHDYGISLIIWVMTMKSMCYNHGMSPIIWVMTKESLL